MARKTYYEKLKDPRWQKKRLEIMERDDWTCQGCGKKEETLNIHHIKYSKNPWESKDDELITLCESCHSELTEINNEITKLLVDYINNGSSESIIDKMKDVKTFVTVCVNGDEPWGVNEIDVKCVILRCLSGSWNDGFWYGSKTKDKKAQ